MTEVNGFDMTPVLLKDISALFQVFTYKATGVNGDKPFTTNHELCTC